MNIRLVYLNQLARRAWLLLTVALSLLGFKVSAQSGLTATVAWDSSTSTNVASYHVYYGTRSGHYTNSVSVDAADTSVTIGGLNAGTTYFFAVTAVDAVSNESSFSSEAYFSIPSAPWLLTQMLSDAAGNLYLEVTSQQVVSRSWEIQYSEDMVNWHGIGSGFDSTVDLLNSVDSIAYPQMFFRLAVF